MPYQTFDLDLAAGKLREDAFGRLLCSTRFEHKRDYWAVRSGNLAIEIEQKQKNGEVKPVLMTNTSEWWALEYREDCRLVLPKDFIHKLVAHALTAKLTKWIGDGHNHHNALIPFSWFLNPPWSVEDDSEGGAKMRDCGA